MIYIRGNDAGKYAKGSLSPLSLPLHSRSIERRERWLSASGETFLEMQIAMRPATQEDTAGQVKLPAERGGRKRERERDFD